VSQIECGKRGDRYMRSTYRKTEEWRRLSVDISSMNGKKLI
jgi:hypothetical protein